MPVCCPGPEPGDKKEGKTNEARKVWEKNLDRRIGWFSITLGEVDKWNGYMTFVKIVGKKESQI